MAEELEDHASSSPAAEARVVDPSAHGGHSPSDAPSSGETEPLVLSRGNLFCVVNRRGDIAPAGARDLGLFHEDTRHLSRLELVVDSATVQMEAADPERVRSGVPLTVLSAETVASSTSQVDLTATDRNFGGFLDDPRNFLHVRRRQLLDELFVERVILTNHLARSVELGVTLYFAADFADIFEVRGARRARRGRPLPPRTAQDRIVYAYRGLDGETYRTEIRFLPEPERVTAESAHYTLHLQPGEAVTLEVCVDALRGDDGCAKWQPFDVRASHVRRDHHAFVDAATRVRCDDKRFEAVLHRALLDIDSLRLVVHAGDTEVPGRGPHRILGAGIPWYAAPFGRDSILTSLEMLLVAPHLAIETLRTLAFFQGRIDDPWREEEPGKIMHELRRGELARAGEIPHSPYFGTIDATPLWLVLLSETWRWTGDDALVDELSANADRALAWIDRKLDEGRGFLRYQRKHGRGLENQGWKDSRDGVSFADGTIAEPPIALVEVQGYVVAAFDAMSRLYRRRGDSRMSHRLRERAGEMRRKIEQAFWVDETGFYAMALDGEDRRVSTIASNPGHLGFCRALPGGRAARLAEVLVGDEMYSGWGVRTVARGQTVYNPLSYHNGTVWPHDNALCALSLALTGHVGAALKIFEGLYAASLHFRDHRLPELFCGMGRGEGDSLVHYPVSCSPQAWASAAFFLLLQAVLGIHPDAPLGRLVIRNPRLPDFLRRLDLDGMRVGGSQVSLRFERHGSRTHVDLVDVKGDQRLKVNIEIG